MDAVREAIPRSAAAASMTPKIPSKHTLSLWADSQKVAALGYEALQDRWSLDYEHDWVNTPEAFSLSPHLPLLHLPENGYAAGAVKRFVENLLPEVVSRTAASWESFS